MDCADAKLRMEPCASGALVPEELALFEEHIATCEGCRLELELVRAGVNKQGDAKPDDWTLDRIFGSESPKASEAPAVPPETIPATAAPAEPAAALGSDADPLPIATMTTGGDASPAATPAESEPSDASLLFETTPNPMPPESPEAPAPSPFTESSAAPPIAAEAPIDGSGMFDEPNPVSAMSVDAAQAPSAAPSKATSAPAPTPAPPARTSAAPGSGDAWDFEPADAKPDAALPEGSLFFAEETLARQGDARKGKNAMKRVVIWGGGALVGVALLALSLWIVFFARESGPNQNLGSSNASTDPVPSGGEAPESLATSGDGAVDSSTAVVPDVVTTPADEVVANPLGARALSGGGVPQLSNPTRTGSQPVAPRSTSGKGDPKKPAVASTPSGSAKSAPTSSGTKPSEVATSTAPNSRVLVTEELDPEQLELREPAPTPVPSERNVPFSAGSKAGDSGQTAAPRKPVVASPPLSVAPSPAEPGSGAPAADAVQRPIDRLHLATVAAEQGSDLVALRKLRDTWKGFVRTSVGPDRARAKRELADCLWAIQFLTGKTSDKKEALAAYREYLLNAPAGGADPRTVARMRQLEDALAESK